MSRIIRLSQLSSRVVRNNVLANSPLPGTRIIRGNQQTQGGLKTRLKEFLVSGFGSIIKFGGWLIKTTIGLIGFSFSSLWSIIVQATSFIYNFNWNISDQQIDQQFEQSKRLISGLAGGTIGNALGFLACGIAPSAAILAVNEPLGYYLLKEVGEEALDEFVANLRILLIISFRVSATNFFYNAFKNARRAIKKYVADNKGNRKKYINSFYGNKFVNAIEGWGEENSKPWSFRLAVEERIESISNPLTQEFVEEAYDEFLDACVEAGYVVANTLDSWVLQQQQANSAREDDANLIEVLPDRDAPEERLIFNGNDRQIRTQIINSLNNFQLIDNRDVGQIIGEPLLDSVKKPPVSLNLRILLRSSPKPPWKNQDGSLAKRALITIPNVKKSKVDWSFIKRSLGGTNGYIWGRFIVIARLDDGNMIKLFAGSESEGKRILNLLTELTEGNVTTINITEETREGVRLQHPGLYKESTRVYPATLTIINQNKILRINEGRETTRGIYKRRQYLIPLYTETKPDNFDLITQELIKKDD